MGQHGHALQALENAVAVVYVLPSDVFFVGSFGSMGSKALGGSTNAVLHTLAIAHEAVATEE